MNPVQKNVPAMPNEFSAKEALNQCFHGAKKNAVAVFEVVKKVSATALTILLALFFPCSFILGAGTALLIGVFASPERLQKSLDRISQVWKNQSGFAVGAIVLMGIWGLPYTPYLAATIRGAYLGISEALRASTTVTH